LPNWDSVVIYNNPLLQDCSSTANASNNASHFGNEIAQPVAFTGSWTAAQVTLKPGAWRIIATLQAVTASAPGTSIMQKMGFQVTTDNTASGWNPNTNGAFAECAGMVTVYPQGDTPQRLTGSMVYVNNTGADVTLYLRGYIASTAGQFGTKGVLRAEKKIA
jgi:hypothetical protein